MTDFILSARGRYDITLNWDLQLGSVRLELAKVVAVSTSDYLRAYVNSLSHSHEPVAVCMGPT